MKRGGNWIMNVLSEICVFFLLFTGICGILRLLRKEDALGKAAGEVLRKINESGRRSALEKREALKRMTEEEGFIGRIDRALVYSTLKRRFPGLFAEKFLALMCALGAFILIAAGSIFSPAGGLICMLSFYAAVYVVIRCMELSALKKTGEELPRLLDLLSSFAASGSVYSGIFGQISIYMNEPLRTVFEECAEEGRVSGDVSTALLSMADKIEHPQFKQLIRNMEITSRKSEDIEGLVSATRRSLRDYIREASDRKSMLRESAINMGLLLLMSFVVLTITSALSETTVAVMLTGTLPGRITIGVMCGVVLMYFGQAASLYK